MGLNQKAELDIVSFNEFCLKESETVFSVNSKDAVRFKAHGKIDIKQEKGIVRLDAVKISAGALNDLPFLFIKNFLSIRELNLKGFVDFSYKNEGRSFNLKSKLQ